MLILCTHVTTLILYYNYSCTVPRALSRPSRAARRCTRGFGWFYTSAELTKLIYIICWLLLRWHVVRGRSTAVRYLTNAEYSRGFGPKEETVRVVTPLYTRKARAAACHHRQLFMLRGPVSCHKRMRVLLLLIVLAMAAPLVCFECAADEPQHARLPQLWRDQLSTFHKQPPSRGGGGDQSWTQEQDATILVQRHFTSPPVPWPKVRVPNRTPGASKKRYMVYLSSNVVAAVSEVESAAAQLLSSTVREAALRAEFNSSGIELPQDMQDSLVALHMNTQQTKAAQPWTIAQDACIVHAKRAGEMVTNVSMDARTPAAIRIPQATAASVQAPLGQLLRIPRVSLQRRWPRAAPRL